MSGRKVVTGIVILLVVLVAAGAVYAAAIATDRTEQPGDTPGETGLANPASVYCEELGGSTELSTGMCVFEDGTEIDEWELFYRDHPSE